ncbi:hypothetical protein D3C83_145750 [compost metagenome]
MLDKYLASTCLSEPRRVEATLLRGLAASMGKKPSAPDSASAEEIRKLKDQLEQTKKELERLKLRIIR